LDIGKGERGGIIASQKAPKMTRRFFVFSTLLLLIRANQIQRATNGQ